MLVRFASSKTQLALVSNKAIPTVKGSHLRVHLPGHGVVPLSGPGTLGDVAIFLAAVITFCDGGEAEGRPGEFDGSAPQRNPAQLLLAVDLDGNGRRDRGEPVISQQGEPLEEVGADGLPSEMESGYDAVRNPDPAGDDYHSLKNPSGAQGNWHHDEGEPFTDPGVDGVAGKGCPIEGSADGCFDDGEGNRRYDVNGSVRRWIVHDPRSLIGGLDLYQLERLDITPKGQVLIQKNGCRSPHGLILPPGCFEPRKQGQSYPP